MTLTCPAPPLPRAPGTLWAAWHAPSRSTASSAPRSSPRGPCNLSGRRRLQLCRERKVTSFFSEKPGRKRPGRAGARRGWNDRGLRRARAETDYVIASVSAEDCASGREEEGSARSSATQQAEFRSGGSRVAPARGEVAPSSPGGRESPSARAW